MLFNRETGILLHPSSLPGPWGTGTLGEYAEQFIDWMADSGVTVWQVLPLSPPVYANSPYQALSSFSLNPLLLSPGKLAMDGLLLDSEVDAVRVECCSSIDWRITRKRQEIIEKAATRALSRPDSLFHDFASLEWVSRWSRFTARKEMNLQRPWHRWRNLSPPPEERVMLHSMVQFLLERQWRSLRKKCRSRGIRILGDLPIYAAHDSADVFYNRRIFKLNPDGTPAYVAGVPPDYFSKTGQLWGNPVYDWQQSGSTGHAWWISRMRRALDLYDAVRIDHFRGFESCWEIPAGSPTAASGKWMSGPGYPLFSRMQSELGDLPVIAEDLGLITESVRILRNMCGFPGMTVLQFSLQDPSFSVESISPATIVYTGTHDNDTTAGWLSTTGNALGYSSVKEVISIALASPAELAVLPMQDVLELGSSARMNIPGTTSGNWSWRLCSLPSPVILSRRE